LTTYTKCPIILTPGNHDFWRPKKYFYPTTHFQEHGIGVLKDGEFSEKVVCLIDEQIEYKGLKQLMQILSKSDKSN